jgi:uncharacterized protein (DUF2236 family)
MNRSVSAARIKQSSTGAPELIAKGSALYAMLGHAVSLIYSYPTTVVPAMHQVGGYGVSQHDRVFDGRIDPVGFEHEIGRFRDTMELVMGVVFGGPKSADIAYAVRELHRGVHGTLPDGNRYHAWNPRMWRWFWSGSVSAWMNLYEAFQGYPSEAFRDDVYVGFVELGRQFGVGDMPPSYQEFVAYWPNERDLFGAGTPEARFLADQLTGRLLKPTKAQWIPTWAWILVTLPVRRTFRMALLAGFSPEQNEQIGVHKNWFDELELRVHKAFWRMVPIALSRRFVPAYFYLRERFGSPSWHRHYSRAALDARRHSTRNPAPGFTRSADVSVELGTRRVVCGGAMGAGTSCCRRKLHQEPSRERAVE